MPFYHRLGKIPPKRHTTFYKEDGKSLYREELVSSLGFSGIYSNKYHIHIPTQFLGVNEISTNLIQEWPEAPVQHYHFSTDKLISKGDYIFSRNTFLYNPHCVLSTAQIDQNTELFFKNAYAHELIFIHHGEGTFFSEYGKMRFSYGDQIVIPKGTIYSMQFDQLKKNKLFIVESDSPFDIPNHYKNDYGQLLEEAPYCERDIKVPNFFDAINDENPKQLILKAGKRYFEYMLQHHPYDVVGWDGYVYPFIFNMKDFCPKVGKVHLPPPVHLVFQTRHFVYCNFCPRLFDFHPNAIPAPYFHYNIDSEEVLYYVEGDFMSRTGVGEGSITLHPMGIPHGPQPGKTESSVGKKETYEYALMVDTFDPLLPTMNVKQTMDPNYMKSWLF